MLSFLLLSLPGEAEHDSQDSGAELYYTIPPMKAYQVLSSPSPSHTEVKQLLDDELKVISVSENDEHSEDESISDAQRKKSMTLYNQAYNHLTTALELNPNCSIYLHYLVSVSSHPRALAFKFYYYILMSCAAITV